MQSAKALAPGVKLAYGVGLAAEGIKNNAFNLFLLFFYQQLVGLDPALCGLALFASLCADAVRHAEIVAEITRRRAALAPAAEVGSSLPLGLCQRHRVVEA